MTEVDVASETAQIGVAVGNVTEEDQMAAGMPLDTSEPLRAEDLVVTSGRSSLDRSPTTTDLALVDRPTVVDKLGEVGETRSECKPKAQYAKFAEGGSVAAKELTIDPKENEATLNLPWKKAVASEGNLIVSVALQHLIAGEPAGYRALSIAEKPQESEVTENVIVDKGLATPFIRKTSALSTSSQDARTEVQEEPTANELDVITSNSASKISVHEYQNVEFAEEDPVLEDSCGLSSTETKPPDPEQAHEERLPLKDNYSSASKPGSQFVDPPENFYDPEGFCNPEEEDDHSSEHTELESVAPISQRGVLDRQDNYLVTSAAAASTQVSNTPSEPDLMVAKPHAEHAITMQSSQSPETLLATLAESSEMPQHVQKEEQPARSERR